MYETAVETNTVDQHCSNMAQYCVLAHLQQKRSLGSQIPYKYPEFVQLHTQYKVHTSY